MDELLSLIYWNTIQIFKMDDLEQCISVGVDLKKCNVDMLSEKSHAKGQILYNSTYISYLTGRFMETESRMVVARGWWERKGKLFNGYGVSLWDDKKVLEIGLGGVYTTL